MLAGQLCLGLDVRPETKVQCVPFSATLSASACARQHDAKIASGRGKGAPVHPRCAACGIGAHRLAILVAQGWRPPAYRPFNVNRDRAQRAARERLWLSGMLDDVPTLDGLPTRTTQ